MVIPEKLAVATQRFQSQWRQGRLDTVQHEIKEASGPGLLAEQGFEIAASSGDANDRHIGTLDAVNDVIAHRETAYAVPEIVPRSTSLRVRVK